MMAGESKTPAMSAAAPGMDATFGATASNLIIETEEGTKTMKTIVSVRSLQKRYQLGKDNYVDALRGASVNIGAGEMVAIMGPSGCGKSTMLHMMGCLDAPDSGEIWLNGRRVDDLSTRATTKLLREEIGFIFQGFNLVTSMTALDNVAMAAQYAGKSRREAQKVAREALEAVGLADRAGHRPSELSGGQQQRVAIARALVNKPLVIMGDEPTGNLDSASSAEVIDMMREINLTTGTTFILVTHDPDVAEACDRVIHMRDGVVTKGTTPDETDSVLDDAWEAVAYAK
jgi:putative ABC transport system ATP-binding protein